MVLEQVLPSVRGSQTRRASQWICCRGTGPKEEQKAWGTFCVKAGRSSSGRSGETLGSAQGGCQLFKDSAEVAALRAKAEQAKEANKLAKLSARPPETAVRDVFTALRRNKASYAKDQEKITELEAAATAAAEAVEKAKQKAAERLALINSLEADYAKEVGRLSQRSDSITHLQTSLRDAFHPLENSAEALPLLSQLQSVFTSLSGMLAAATPTPAAVEELPDDVDMKPDKGLSAEAAARAFARSLEGLPEEESEAKKQKFKEFVDEELGV